MLSSGYAKFCTACSVESPKCIIQKSWNPLGDPPPSITLLEPSCTASSPAHCPPRAVPGLGSVLYMSQGPRLLLESHIYVQTMQLGRAWFQY